MTASLSIGEFSRATYLSVKTLRHYHDVGLLEPAHIDPSSGYRYYRADQIGTAQIIRRLRDLEMPIHQVKGVLGATDLRARQGLIAAHLRSMEDQLERTATAVTALRTLLDEAGDVAPITHRTVHSTHALAISAVVTLDALVSWWTTAFEELSDTLAAAEVRPAGHRGALYAQDVFESQQGEVVVFMPVEHPIPGSGRARQVLVPPAELAVTVHRGSHDDLDRSYGALGRYVAEHALHVQTPVREYYPVGPQDSENPDDWRTEIAWPIEPRDHNPPM